MARFSPTQEEADPLEIKLTVKQVEYLREARHRWNFAVGAVRSGKSHLAVRHTIPDRLIKFRGRRGLNLILGATRESIERNVLEPMREMWGDSLVSDINTRNQAILFGERVYCIGAENKRQVSKIRGSEIKFCYCDEICDINEEVFEMLKSRLSLPYSECHAACNPAGPNHFIKRFIDSASGSPDIDLYCQEYTIYDNPFLPSSYVKSLEAEYRGTVYFKRYILGLWAMAEGLVYPMWENALEGKFEQPCFGYGISVDYGTQNAFAALKWKKDSDGTWHIVDEYRYSGRDTGHQKTDEDYVKDLVAFTDDAPHGETIEVFVDPSASSFIAALRRCKDREFRVRKADNDVENGIRDVAVCLQSRRVKVSKECTGTAKEFQGYCWDDKSDGDRPVKIEDHCMDALRYFVRTKRLYKPDEQYTPIFG